MTSSPQIEDNYSLQSMNSNPQFSNTSLQSLNSSPQIADNTSLLSMNSNPQFSNASLQSLNTDFYSTNGSLLSLNSAPQIEISNAELNNNNPYHNTRIIEEDESAYEEVMFDDIYDEVASPWLNGATPLFDPELLDTSDNSSMTSSMWDDDLQPRPPHQGHHPPRYSSFPSKFSPTPLLKSFSLPRFNRSNSEGGKSHSSTLSAGKYSLYSSGSRSSLKPEKSPRSRPKLRSLDESENPYQTRSQARGENKKIGDKVKDILKRRQGHHSGSYKMKQLQKEADDSEEGERGRPQLNSMQPLVKASGLTSYSLGNPEGNAGRPSPGQPGQPAPGAPAKWDWKSVLYTSWQVPIVDSLVMMIRGVSWCLV